MFIIRKPYDITKKKRSCNKILNLIELNIMFGLRCVLGSLLQINVNYYFGFYSMSNNEKYLATGVD